MPRINASGDGVRVQGLNEVNRALRELGGRELQKELKATGLEVAEDVADDATSKALALGGVAAKTAPSIKASARFTGAGVSIGGAAYPFAGGAEFGAGQDKIRRRKSGTYVGYRQFEPWRGNGSGAGYFVYPAIRDNSDHIAEDYLGAVEQLARKHGLL